MAAAISLFDCPPRTRRRTSSSLLVRPGSSGFRVGSGPPVEVGYLRDDGARRASRDSARARRSRAVASRPAARPGRSGAWSARWGLVGLPAAPTRLRPLPRPQPAAVRPPPGQGLLPGQSPRTTVATPLHTGRRRPLRERAPLSIRACLAPSPGRRPRTRLPVLSRHNGLDSPMSYRWSARHPRRPGGRSLGRQRQSISSVCDGSSMLMRCNRAASTPQAAARRAAVARSPRRSRSRRYPPHTRSGAQRRSIRGPPGYLQSLIPHPSTRAARQVDRRNATLVLASPCPRRRRCLAARALPPARTRPRRRALRSSREYSA